MAQILLPGLSPGTIYNVQARAVNSTGVSEWSPLFSFTTPGDTIAPSPVTSLSWTVVGTAFAGTWTAPTTNSDTTVLKDFKDYQVTLVANSITIIAYTTEPRYDLSFEQNKNMFGTPQATVQITVKARDISGNLSTAVTTSATNPAPAQPANLVITPLNEALGVKWDAVADTDIDHYEVNMSTTGGFTPSGANLIYSGFGTGTTIITAANYALEFIKVCAVDVFGTKSTYASSSGTPNQSTSVDLTAPALPTGLTVTGAVDTKDPSGANIIASVSWTQTSVTDLAGFTIRYRKTGDTNWFLVNVYDGALRAATVTGLSPGTGYDFQIKSFDFSGNTAGYTSTATMASVTDAAAPGGPTGVTMSAGITTVVLFWTENTETDVKNGAGTYEVQIATNSGFSTGVQTNKTTATITSFSGLVAGTTYWGRVRAVDSSGNASSYTATTPTSITASSVANADIAAGTINADRLITASITATQIAAATITANKIDMTNFYATAGTVTNTLTIGASGIIQSSNYSAGTAGWQLSQNGLEINGGTIRAASLLLQISPNIVPLEYADFEYQSTFYTSSVFVVANAPTLTIDTVGANVKYNQQSLKIVAGGSIPTIDFTTGATTYNIVTDSSTTYIVSMWVLQSSGGSKNVNIRFKDSATSVQTSANLAVPSGTYTRVSATFTTNSAATGAWVGITVPISTTYWIDGVQVEKQMTSATTPSSWNPPSDTQIDGGIIRTGSIQSTNLISTGQSSGTQPSWSINVAGGATFANALIRGHLIVGDSGSSGLLTDQYIASANFSAGTSGYIVKGDGNVEFNSGTFRGTLNVGGATGVTINGTSGIWAGAAQSASTIATPGTISLAFVTTGGTFSSTSSGLTRIFYYVVSAVDSNGKETGVSPAINGAFPGAVSTPTIPAGIVSASTGSNWTATTYFFVATLVGLSGETVKSNEVSVALTATTYPNIPLPTVTNNLISMRIYYGTVSGTYTNYIEISPANASLSNTFAWTNKTSMTGYTIAAGTPPVSNTSANSTTGSINLSWTAVPSAASYNVYRRTGDSSWFKKNTASASLTDTSSTSGWTAQTAFNPTDATAAPFSVSTAGVATISGASVFNGTLKSSAGGSRVEIGPVQAYASNPWSAWDGVAFYTGDPSEFGPGFISLGFNPTLWTGDAWITHIRSPNFGRTQSTSSSLKLYSGTRDGVSPTGATGVTSPTIVAEVGSPDGVFLVTGPIKQKIDYSNASFVPAGRIAGATTNTEVTFTTVTTFLTAFSDISVTVPSVTPARKYLIMLTTYTTTGTTADSTFIRIYDGGASAPTSGSTLLFADTVSNVAAARYERATYVIEWNPTAGVHRLGVAASRNTGTSTHTLGSTASGRISTIAIVDVGT